MEENFDLLAQSRANYYTKGSPIQFVKVELLKGDVTGDIAVCLSFKNITNQPIVALLVQFKCKDRTGAVVCQDEFCYQGLDTSNGQVFGSDDAVYIGTDAIGSVEVDLLEAYLADGGIIDLTGFSRTRLPAPKKLPADVASRLEERTRKNGLEYVPQVLDQGWYCACGAFHPREEEGVWCSECGSDRILLQNTLSTLLQTGASAQRVAADEQPTRLVSSAQDQAATRAVPPLKKEGVYVQQFGQRGYNVPPPQPEPEDDSDMRVVPDARRRAAGAARDLYRDNPVQKDQEDWQGDQYDDGEGYDDYEDYSEGYDEEFDPRDLVAERIIRWAPPITAVLCGLIALTGFLLMR